MSIPTFTPGYPPDGSSLGETKATIRDNIDGNFQVFSVDHQDQNETSAGTHTKVSLKETTGTTTPTLPPNILGGGFETLYSQPAGSAPLGPLGEIFYSRGGGAGIQLTGPGTPNGAANGNTFLAGNILIQWGIVNSTTSGTVTYTSANLGFQSAVYGIFTQPFYSGSAPNGTATVAIKKNTILSFDWTFITNSGAYNGFYWVVIGR